MNKPLDKTSPAVVRRAYDAEAVRKDFPIMARTVYGKPLHYLDTAASAQKPQVVIDAISHCYEAEYANIHRGVHYLAEKATENYEAARAKIARFLNAGSPSELIFVRNATEAINLVAASYGRKFLSEGDEIILSEMEHHSNIVPWQLLRDAIGVKLVVVPITETGELDMDAYKRSFTDRTRLVAITHMSNALGTITPIADIIRIAHDAGAKILVDGCQAVPHMKVDVRTLDADFYALSSHKLYGPSGIGVLYAKREILEAMPPYQGGGEMIRSVTFERTTYADLPHKFEAGTPHISGAIGFGAAIDYVDQFDFEEILVHEMALAEDLRRRLGEINSVRIFGEAKHRGAIVSFTIDGIHPHDAGTILDREGVAVRGGHHCAQPVMDHFGIPGTLRASFGMYNTQADVEAAVAAVRKAMEIFG